MDQILATTEIQVEKKHLTIDVCENGRGRFLRITEWSHGRRNAVIVPDTGLEQFTAAIDDVLSQAEKATPA